jgi:O-antigen/teichoic acid export membrane protein
MSSTINQEALNKLNEVSPLPNIEGPEKSRGVVAAVSKNIVASLSRVMAVSLVALVLPAYLTHHLPVTTYAAWVLILELGAYVSYLDLGVQTAVSKFVAEYDAKGDRNGAGRHASAGFVLMMFAGALGLLLTLVLMWQVPRLFSRMPADLYRDVRISVILVGTSLCFRLICAVYSAVFLGLQRYWIPMTISIANRVSFVAIIIVVVTLHGSLTAMGLAVALINVATGVTQVVAWRKKARHIRISTRLLEFPVLKKVARYCSLQSIWTVGMLCVTGLDITIVGHYDYVQTAYYSIATLPTSFLLLIMSSMMDPLMPASSALSTRRSAADMGNILARITRYSTVILLLTGLPLMVYGLPILRIWVGPSYAIHTIRYLQILIFANIIRNLCLPYATMITATGRQEAAIATAVTEAAVNLSCSIYLASRFGAIGVALGTLLGSLVSVSLHFAITMHYTHSSLAISRTELFLKGLLRPAMIALPSLALFPLWRSPERMTLNPGLALVWLSSTLFLAFFGALDGKERDQLKGTLRRRVLLWQTR